MLGRRRARDAHPSILGFDRPTRSGERRGLGYSAPFTTASVPIIVVGCTSHWKKYAGLVQRVHVVRGLVAGPTAMSRPRRAARRPVRRVHVHVVRHALVLVVEVDRERLAGRRARQSVSKPFPSGARWQARSMVDLAAPSGAPPAPPATGAAVGLGRATCRSVDIAPGRRAEVLADRAVPGEVHVGSVGPRPRPTGTRPCRASTVSTGAKSPPSVDATSARRWSVPGDVQHAVPVDGDAGGGLHGRELARDPWPDVGVGDVGRRPIRARPGSASFTPPSPS